MEENNQKNNQTNISSNGIEPEVKDVVAEVQTGSGENVVEAMPVVLAEEIPSPVLETPTTVVVEPAPVVVAEEVNISESLLTENTVTNGGVPNMRKKLITQYSIATLIVLLIGVGLAYALEQQGRIHTGIFTKVNELINPTPAVATVNGVKIPVTDYNKNLDQLTAAASQQGADVATDTVKEEIKQQALDVLVNTELLKQAAKKAGVVVTQDQIDTRRKEIVTQLGDEEKLQAKMKELGITEESLDRDISGEILIQTHLKTAVDVSKVTVTDEELKVAYDQIVGTQKKGDVPPLEQIKTQLESQLSSNKQQDLINTYIKTLREGADVKILI